MGFSVFSFLALAFDTVLLCVSLFVSLYSLLQGLYGLLYGLYLLPFGLYRLMNELYGLYGMYGLLYGLYGSCGFYLLYKLLHGLYGLLERLSLRTSVIEEICEPSYPNLAHMPEFVMRKVLKNLDTKSIFRLRKVCRDVRFSVDTIKPELHLKNLRFELILPSYESCLIRLALRGCSEQNMDLNNPRTWTSFLCCEPQPRYEDDFSRNVNISDCKPRTRCVLRWKEGCFFKNPIPVKEAQSFLKNTKLTLDELKIDVCSFVEYNTEYIEKQEEDIKKFYESMKTLFKNERHLLKVKKVRLEVQNLTQAIDLLECIDSKSFKSVSVRFREWLSVSEAWEQWETEQFFWEPHHTLPSFKRLDDFILFSEREDLDSKLLNRDAIQSMEWRSRLEKHEQWKNIFPRWEASCALPPNARFVPFELVSEWKDERKIEKLNELREFFIRSPNMKTCYIESEKITEMKSQILLSFDQIDSCHEELKNDPRLRKTWTWLTDIPASSKKLETTLSIHSKNYISFAKV